jgi:hypothetical protein
VIETSLILEPLIRSRRAGVLYDNQRRFSAIMEAVSNASWRLAARILDNARNRAVQAGHT